MLGSATDVRALDFVIGDSNKKDFVIGDSVVWDTFHQLWNQALKLIWSKTITAEFKYFDMHHKTATIFTLVLWVKMSQNVQEMHLTVSSFFVLLQIKLERMILTCIAKL
jgi:hypothetical protein